MVWTVKSAVTAVMLMDVTTLLVTVTVSLVGLVRSNHIAFLDGFALTYFKGFHPAELSFVHQSTICN